MNRCPYRLIHGAACVAASEPGHGVAEVSCVVIRGVGKLAQELGVRRESIYRTMRGLLNSARLRRELQSRGLHPIPYRHKRGPRKQKTSVAGSPR